MNQNSHKTFNISATDIFRKLILAWLFSAAIESSLSSGSMADLSTLSDMSFHRLLLLIIVTFSVLLTLRRFIFSWIERWSMVACFIWMSGKTLISSFTPAYLCACLLITAILVYYSIRGWNGQSECQCANRATSPAWGWITGVLAILFFLFVSIWTVSRVISFCTPTYDFGIFSQMFHSMKSKGLPLTTLERDGLLSHFKVHMSPIYYLILPVYWLSPRPETLQVMQAAILASAVIPLWLLGKRYNLPGMLRAVLCALLLLYPAYAGGTSYDIHENAFLTPLILWLLYAIDCQNHILSGVFTVLVLAVKEDAAVYCAVIALYVIIRSLTREEYRRQLIAGCVMLVFSVIWFIIVTGYLSSAGDGVMTYRYNNFIYDGTGSLFSVIKAVLLCPLKAVSECVDPQKIKFIAYTLLPILGIPLLTRKYERYILLIPYILVNLMSDYQYQHDIFFQYTYGSTACLFYLVIINIADFKFNLVKCVSLLTATAISVACFLGTVVPKAAPYPRYCSENAAHYAQIRKTLDTIPQDASVCATTFYTTYLSQRDTLYDVRYASFEHLLDCEYIVLTTTSESCYKSYATNGENGLNNLIELLEGYGYTVYSQLEGTLIIYSK